MDITNEDIDLCLRLQFDDLGINDTELVQSLIDECKINKIYDVNESIINNFDIEDQISYSFENNIYRNSIDNINRFVNQDHFELTNDQTRTLLRHEYSYMNHTNQNNNMNPIYQLFGGSSFGYPQLFQYPLGNIDVTSNVNQEVINPFSEILNLFNPSFGQNVPITLTERALDDLNEYTFSELKSVNGNIDKEEKCCICYSKLDEDEKNFKYTILGCNHIFHSNCIKTYLKNYNYQCPICKKPCGEHVAKI